MQADDATVDRIKNLGFVGTALMEIANENTHQSKYLVAKQSLVKFMEGINQLDLSPVEKKGMQDLVSYLDSKLQKRLNNSI